MHDSQNLERGDNAVACRGEIAEDDVTALFAAEVQFLPHHFFDDITIADFCSHDFAAAAASASSRPKLLMTVATTGCFAPADRFQKIQRRDREDFIAVDDVAVFVAKQNAIGVAVVANADIRAVVWTIRWISSDAGVRNRR